MFDIGGWEFLIVIVIAIVVIGPKDLPGTIRTVSGWVRRARELARDFQSGLDDLARETDMENVKSDIQSGLGLDDAADAGNTIRNQIENTIDPDGDIDKAFKEGAQEFEEDGPFADNSFEEDEEIDGADPAETEISEDAQPLPDEPLTITDEQDINQLDDVASRAAKKA